MPASGATCAPTRADGRSLIVMDAPPPQEDVPPFRRRRAPARGRRPARARACSRPMRSAASCCSTDLGSRLYLGALDDAVGAGDLKTADALMRDAIARLIRWQGSADAATLPPYDDALLRRELALFPEWCVGREYGVAWAPSRKRSGKPRATCSSTSALAQPRVAVHRDFMPRNLMVADAEPRRPRLPGRGARPDQLRRRLAAARCVHLVGGGAGARLGGALLGSGPQGRAAGAATTSATSGAPSSGWGCSAT